MGGKYNPWSDSHNKETYSGGPGRDEVPQNITQKYDDGVLELCCAETMIELSLGSMSRLGQMSGPIQVNFKEFPQPKGFLMYLNMDGEYLKIFNARSVKIQLSD